MLVDAEDSIAKKQDAKERTGLSFSSASSGPPSKSRLMMAKRKAVGSARGEDEGEGGGGGATASKVKKVKKKPRVGLSFADDA